MSNLSVPFVSSVNILLTDLRKVEQFHAEVHDLLDYIRQLEPTHSGADLYQFVSLKKPVGEDWLDMMFEKIERVSACVENTSDLLGIPY